MVKTSEHASYDEIQDADDQNTSLTYNEARQMFLHSKKVATCYVARR